MNLSSVIVYARPGASSQVSAALLRMSGVEVHAEAPDGRLVVTVEAADAGAGADAYGAIERIGGVLSVALVYQRSESEPDREI